MKRKILVATDFSETSHNAYLYARELAKVFNCTIEVVHAYRTSFSKSTVTSLMAEAGNFNTAKKKMTDFINDYPKEKGTVMTKLEVNTNIVESSPITHLVKESEVENVFMIVMGASDKLVSLARLIGRISSKVAQKAHCPVLLVPKSANYQGYNNILYASNFEAAQEGAVQKIADFANVFRAAIHFVHIEEVGESEDFILTEGRIFGQLFKSGEPAFAFYMDSLKAESVVNGLHQYAKENKVELIVLANRHRSFVDSIWGKSLTMKMALDIKFPLLVFHIT